MEAQALILTKEVYNQWLDENNCYDFGSGRIISKEDRLKEALETIRRIWPDDENTVEDAEEYIMENTEDFPETLAEFEDYNQTLTTEYISPSGDELVIVVWEYSW